MVTDKARTLIEELALGSRLDPEGLNHDEDSLMELAALAVRMGDHYLAERLKRHALRVNSLHMELLKERP